MLIYQLVRPDEPVSIPVKLTRYKCVLLIERDIEDEFRNEVSRLLVEGGCLYAMAWGRDCSAWDDSIDHANLAMFDYGDIPADKFVMTTWHDDCALEDVLDFAKNCAVSSFDDAPLEDLLVLDFSLEDRAAKIEAMFNQVG